MTVQMMPFLWGVIFHSVGASSERPNIVFIIADDLGFHDVGFHGSDVRTPNIDALAGHGIILKRHYALPSCSPSRAALMTAKYPIRTGMQGLPIGSGVAKGLPLNEKIFPQYFKDLDYKSHLVGKWHLGYETWAHVPTNRGFNSFYGYYGGAIGYYDAIFSQYGMSGRDFRRDETPIWEEVYGKYMTDVLTKEAVSVIKNHEGRGGLLLFLTHLAPHKGNHDLLREAPPNNVNFTERGVYRATVRRLDDSVGELVSALNDKGILNNTIIVFLSDNGAPTVDYINGYENHGSNWPLRGLKMSSHEGGIRTPALIWSPLLKQPRISTDLFHISDWLPTLYTAAGGNSRALRYKDGISQWHSLVTGVPGPRNEVLLNIDEFSENEAIIKGKWKLVKSYELSSPVAFYDSYYERPGTIDPYNEVDVENSVAGLILGKPKVPYQEVLQGARINQSCPDVSAAEATDCSSKYCLYDILADELECRDLSSHYPLIVSELESKLSSFKRVMLPGRLNVPDPKADPKYWGDYWSPWLGSGVTSSSSNMMLLSATISFKLRHFLL